MCFFRVHLISLSMSPDYRCISTRSLLWVLSLLRTQANDKGDYFPVWGTCLGFELLSFIQSGNDVSVLSAMDASNLSLPLVFTEGVCERELENTLYPCLFYVRACISFPFGINITHTHKNICTSFIAGSSGSHLFSQFTQDAFKWISTEPLTFNSHHWGVTTQTFNANPKLNQFFTVLSTNKDRKGVEFVSSMEGNGQTWT